MVTLDQVAALGVADEALTDQLLTPAELDLRDRLRAVIALDVAPRAADTDRTGTFAEAGYQALARAGLAGLLIPADRGGSGATTVAYALAVEEICAACPSTALIYMTQLHAAYPILVAGTEEQQRAHLGALAAGEQYGALAITEPDAGSDASGIHTTARRDGDGYVLDGAKTFITTGDRAHVIIVFATVDASRGRDGVTAFLVPGDSPGLSRGKVLDKLGMHGSSTAELFFDAVSIPASARLGEEGGAWRLSMATVVKSRISAASQGVGMARAAYAVALRWAAEQGRLRGHEHQDIQFLLADLRTRICTSRLLLHAVARAVDAGDRDLTAEVAMAKATCTDLGVSVAEQVIDMLGPAGDLADIGVERLLRDAKVTQIYDGTNQIQRVLIARDSSRRLGEH